MIYKIKQWWWETKNWITNCFRFRKALSNTMSWDYCGSLYYMQTHMKLLSENLHNKNVAKKAHLCYLLIDRIQNDVEQRYLKEVDYCEYVGIVSTRKSLATINPESKFARTHLSRSNRQDWEMLTGTLNKHMYIMFD